MNRKLQRSTLALSATTALLALMLLAGGPVLPPQPASIAPLALNGDRALSDDTSDINADVDRRDQRRHVRRSRAALALPYFSFAQGLRRVTGS